MDMDIKAKFEKYMSEQCWFCCFSFYFIILYHKHFLSVRRFIPTKVYVGRYFMWHICVWVKFQMNSRMAKYSKIIQPFYHINLFDYIHFEYMYHIERGRQTDNETKWHGEMNTHSTHEKCYKIMLFVFLLTKYMWLLYCFKCVCVSFDVFWKE